MADINNIQNLEHQNIISRPHTIFTKPFPDMLKIEVFFGNNF